MGALQVAPRADDPGQAVDRRNRQPLEGAMMAYDDRGLWKVNFDQ